MNNNSNQRKWIPTRENLPNKTQNCLFTLYSPAYHDTTDELLEGDRDFPEELKTVMGRVFIRKNNRYWQFEDEVGEAIIKNEYSKEYTGCETYVTAWMPLPLPYCGRRGIKNE